MAKLSGDDSVFTHSLFKPRSTKDVQKLFAQADRNTCEQLIKCECLGFVNVIYSTDRFVYSGDWIHRRQTIKV